jgi:hypothetical protein
VFSLNTVLFAYGDATTALSMYNNCLNILVVNLPLISVNYFLGNNTKQNQVFGDCLELNSDLLFCNQHIINKQKAVPVHASYVPLKPEAGCLQSDFYWW